MGADNRFALFTPNTSAIVQQFSGKHGGARRQFADRLQQAELRPSRTFRFADYVEQLEVLQISSHWPPPLEVQVEPFVTGNPARQQEDTSPSSSEIPLHRILEHHELLLQNRFHPLAHSDRTCRKQFSQRRCSGEFAAALQIGRTASVPR